MKLDYFTLFTIIALIDIVIVIIFFYFIISVKSGKWFINTYLAYKILESIALVGFSLRNHIPDFISIEIANTIFTIAAFIHVISIISFRGKLKIKISGILAGITVFWSILFLYFSYDDKIRTICSSLSIFTIYLITSIYLFSIRKPFKMPVPIALIFLLYSITNLARGLSLFYNKEIYDITTLYIWDSILIISGIITIIVSTIGYILLLKEVDENDLYIKNRLNMVAFEQSPVSIVISDIEGKIKYVNPKFTQLTGYSTEEVFDKKTNILRTERTPAETFPNLWNTIKSGKIWKGEFVNKKKNNEIYYEEAVIAPIINHNNEIENFIAIKMEITQRKKDEEIIKNRTEELLELNATKDKMFSIIAHDLRGPLGTFQGLISIIESFIDEGDTEKIKEFISLIKNSSKSTFELLENLLAWSRSQLKSISINFTEIDINEIISETMQLLEGSLHQKKITLENISKNNYIAIADNEMIKTVIRNIISNAIKFTSENGKIIVDQKLENDMVKISIHDNGIGIEKERLSKLFNFLENQSTIGTSGEKGTGLGLVLANEFVQKNNGRIYVESEIGKGSTFYICLKSKN